ncbi:MAG: hypothetical protein RIC55_36180 [Pirellulaceae bacterium]
MPWSPQTTTALRNWIGKPTWHTSHPLDEQRFYRFIAAVWRDEHGIWNEALARETMVREAMSLDPEIGREFAEEEVDLWRSKGTLILDFFSNMRELGMLGSLAE